MHAAPQIVKLASARRSADRKVYQRAPLRRS